MAAVTLAKSTEPKKVAATLRSTSAETVLGRIGFDKNGDVNAPGYVMYEWKGGTYDYVEK